MNKQDLIDNDIMTQEEIQEYEDLLILEKFYNRINEQIDIEIDKEPVEKKYYVFDKGRGKYRVRKLVDGKRKYFGWYSTEQQAIARVEELKKEGVI